MRGVLLEVSTQPDAWCSVVRERFPDLRVLVTAHFPLDQVRSIEEVRFEGPDADVAVEIARANGRVERLDILERSPEAVTAALTVCGCFLPLAVRSTQLIPTIPYELGPGGHRWFLVGPPPNVQRFIETLLQAGATVRVLFTGPLRQGELTARQRQVLGLAIRKGYYDYPRRTTLSEMAESLGITRASLSELLMRSEGKVIRATLGSAIGATRAPGPLQLGWSQHPPAATPRHDESPGPGVSTSVVAPGRPREARQA